MSFESLAITMFGEPYLFADVAIDLEGDQPQVHAGDVFAVSDSSKRKLPEIACAIDRQGVNIYNVNAVRIHIVSQLKSDRLDHQRSPHPTPYPHSPP